MKGAVAAAVALMGLVALTVPTVAASATGPTGGAGPTGCYGPTGAVGPTGVIHEPLMYKNHIAESGLVKQAHSGVAWGWWFGLGALVVLALIAAPRAIRRKP